MSFWNRSEEMGRIQRELGRGRFGYVTGRRRVGKSALLEEACRRFGGFYHQAVEGTPQQQLLHLSEELRESLPIFHDIVPRGWNEFFRLLSKEKLPKLLVFDEFPYWVSGDPALPSILQKWVDHELPKAKTLMLVSGSSQAMLHSQFLDQAAPLYGRTSLHLDLQPMGYAWFCRALGYDVAAPESFARFSLVGGVPHYWRLLPKAPLLDQAQLLYFDPSAILAEEPVRIVRDEGITGTLPKAILDLVGRGVSKPSELASRIGTAQGNLSRPLALLLELGLIHRQLPFGESSRTTKRVFYQVQDPALSFYYAVYLPFRARWPALSREERMQILRQHVSRQWEDFCRQAYPGSARYWQADVALDLVCRIKRKERVLVAECKWGRLSAGEEESLKKNLRERFERSPLAHSLKKAEFRIFTQRDLAEMAR